MAINEKDIIIEYSTCKEDERATINRSSSLEFFYTKKHLEGFIKPSSRVLEIGCATGHYGFYYADKCKEYVGVDLVPLHIEVFNQKIANSGLKNISCQIGDATNLKDIKDESFDVVLCLGPMYHLPPKERELVFAQCRRVCVSGGIIAFSYINRIGVYAGACVYDDDNYRKTYPSKKANEFILVHNKDDLKPDVFYFTSPEEMNEAAFSHGLIKLKNLATDFFITMSIVNNMTNEQFEVMKPLYDQMVSHESCTGMSNHALLICKKK